MQKGRVSVNTENIFPIIKKFLYTDHEIFLRELISNAVDASNKIKLLSSREDVGDLGELKITVDIDEKANTLTISDNGIGMTEEEIDKYINQIAFSGAEEFVEKFKDKKEDANIIGHFGLGFYSAFMVADKVEIESLSFQNEAKPAHWVCEGSTEFKITRGKRKKRGTDITLHINEENKEFLQPYKVRELLNKYCKFLPVPIEFEGDQINNTDPIWKKNPADLSDEEYIAFYSDLYPMSEPPLFWIHLNVDYPFNLTGILYFPKIKREIDPNRNKIQLYSNQVFVTENVEDIVPEYLMLLHGVIDSPDIPLNVSRSSLQADGAVKKITGHISKKVSDKLNELFKKDRADFEKKWNNMSLFVKYGMISDEKFYGRANSFCLVKNTEDEFSTIEEYVEKVKPLQTDKDDKVILLYSSDKDAQHSYIHSARSRDYDVLLFDEIIDNHFVSMLESKNDNVHLRRVDSDTIDQLIEKDEKPEAVLSETELEAVKKAFESVVDVAKFEVKTVAMNPADQFVTITRSEFERRMSEMQGMGGMSFFGAMPEKYIISVNANHHLAKKVSEGNAEDVIATAVDLAKLSQNLLKGEELSSFIDKQMNSL